MDVPRIYLRPSDGSGSLEEYWHYLFGYLLPSSQLLESELGSWDSPSRRVRIVLHSAGPVMNAVAEAVLEPTGHGIEFQDLRVRGWRRRRIRGLAPPAAGFASSASAQSRGFEQLAQQLRSRSRRLPRMPWRARLAARSHGDAWLVVPRLDTAAWWWDPSLPVSSAALERGHVALNRLLDLQPPCDHAVEHVGQVIVIERSTQPPFYEQGGGSLVPTYGRGRRRLANIDGVVAAIVAAGMPASTYEPGAHTLRCQSSVFSAASGVVGVRGAEFANLLWAAPGTRAVVLNPSHMWPAHSPAVQLAAYRGVPLTEIAVTGDDVRADPDAVVSALGG